ncbi:phasin family protein [soil metagenome]
MPTPLPNDFAAAVASQLENQQAAWKELTSNTLESVRKLVELNMKVMRESMGESAAATKQLMAAKTPQEFLSLSAAQAKPNIDKVLAYGREVASITSSIQSELGKAVKIQIAESTQRVEPVAKQFAKAAPAESENVYTILKTAMEKSNLGYDQWLKMTQRASTQMEAKMTEAANGFAEAAKKAATGTMLVQGSKAAASPPAAKPATSATKKKSPAPAKKSAAKKKAAK